MIRQIIVVSLMLLLVLPTAVFAKEKKENLEFKSPEGWIFYYQKPVQGEEKIQILGALAATIGRDIGRIFLQVYDEPGDYHFFGILMTKETKLLLSPQTRVILKLKSGKDVSSEALFFTESQQSSRLWDSRQGKTLVNLQEMMTVGNPPCVVVMVKFPKGKFLINDVTEMTVENVATLSLIKAVSKGGELR